MGRVGQKFLISQVWTDSPRSRTKKKDIYVISTPKRPVPLEHYLYAGREMYKIVDASGKFLNTGFVHVEFLHLLIGW